MCDYIKDEWTERWKDKAEMREEDWYKKYFLGEFYFKYVGLIEHIHDISTLQNVKSKFILWYFEHFLPYYL